MARQRTTSRSEQPASIRSAIRSAQPVIVIDTREQLPYEFPCETVRAGLPSGDYSLVGHELAVAVERKRPIELFSCFTAERDRFRREFVRLSSYRRAVVVIEGTIEDCSSRACSYSRVSPHVVIQSLIKWYHRYGVGHVFAGSRDYAEAYTYHFLRNFLALVLEENASTATATMSPESQPA